MIKQSRIYFIGIGGIGMSALARLLLASNKYVSGSDMRDSSTVQELRGLGVMVKIGHSEENIKAEAPDLVVYSEDISPDSKGFVELKTAQEQGIAAMTYAQALGMAMDGKFQICVTGTNGKSTTTAMLGLILEAGKKDPSVIVGSKLSDKNESPKFKANARLGISKYFVAEADEYHRHMMEMQPSMVVLTNVAEDHLDYYRDIAEIKTAFSDFVKLMPVDGTIVYNADDHEAVEVGRAAHCHKLTFGIDHYADLQALNVKVESGMQTFDLHFKNEMIGTMELPVPGKYNIHNALGATLAALHLGVKFPVIKKTLANFGGLWRRFESVGKLGKTEIISDYAHHPEAVAGVIQACKQFYPDKKILFVFQPHHRNRTKKLFGEFVDALAFADDLILPEIFDVAGREHGESVSSKDLVRELQAKKVRVEFAADQDELAKILRLKVVDFDMVVMMGAGDIDNTARKLIL